jgi:hypothetical protein
MLMFGKVLGGFVRFHVSLGAGPGEWPRVSVSSCLRNQSQEKTCMDLFVLLCLTVPSSSFRPESTFIVRSVSALYLNRHRSSDDGRCDPWTL